MYVKQKYMRAADVFRVITRFTTLGQRIFFKEKEEE